MSSKAAKKNQKRREKKKDEKITSLVEERKQEEAKVDPVLTLKAQLADAKSSGDHKLAAKLRQDLWVLQDASSGVTMKLEQEEVKESMDRITDQHFTSPKAQTAPDKGILTTSDSSTSSLSSFEKDIRKLKKKLDQVEKLKKMQSDGTTLEETQLEKIRKEEDFKQEIADLEKMLNSVKVVR